MNQRDDTPGNESGERRRESNGGRDFYPGSHGFEDTRERPLGSSGAGGRQRSSSPMQSQPAEPHGQYEREARDQGQQRFEGGRDPPYDQRRFSQGHSESDRYRPVTEEWEAARGYGGGRYPPERPGENRFDEDRDREGRYGYRRVGAEELGHGGGQGRYGESRSGAYGESRYGGGWAHGYGEGRHDESRYDDGRQDESRYGRYSEGRYSERRHGERRHAEGGPGEGGYEGAGLYGEGRQEDWYGGGRYREGRHGEGRYGEGRPGQRSYSSQGPYREGQYRLARRYGWEAGASQPYYGPRAYRSGHPSWQDQYGFGQRTYGREPHSGRSRTPYPEGGFPRDQYAPEHSSGPLSHREPFAGNEEPRYYGTGAPGWGGTGFAGGAYGYGGDAHDQRRSLEDEYSDESAVSYEQRGARQDYSRYGPSYRNRPFASGPKGYQRSDERLKEDISERLMEARHIDSSEVTVDVRGAKVFLEGEVPSRHMKHAIEDLVDACPGVQDIENRIRVSSPSYPGARGTSQGGSQFASGTSPGAAGSTGSWQGATGTAQGASGTTGASGMTQGSSGTSSSPSSQAASGSQSSSQTGTGSSSGSSGSSKSK